MQTMYYKTSNFIEHTGNLVDLGEFRRRQSLAQADSLARQPAPFYGEPEPWQTSEESGFRPVVLTLSRSQRRRAREERQAWRLDACASLAVVFMTLIFALRVML